MKSTPKTTGKPCTFSLRDVEQNSIVCQVIPAGEIDLLAVAHLASSVPLHERRAVLSEVCRALDIPVARANLIFREYVDSGVRDALRRRPRKWSREISRATANGRVLANPWIYDPIATTAILYWLDSYTAPKRPRAQFFHQDSA